MARTSVPGGPGPPQNADRCALEPTRAERWCSSTGDRRRQGPFPGLQRGHVDSRHFNGGSTESCSKGLRAARTARRAPGRRLSLRCRPPASACALTDHW